MSALSLYNILKHDLPVPEGTVTLIDNPTRYGTERLSLHRENPDCWDLERTARNARVLGVGGLRELAANLSDQVHSLSTVRMCGACGRSPEMMEFTADLADVLSVSATLIQAKFSVFKLSRDERPGRRDLRLLASQLIGVYELLQAGTSAKVADYLRGQLKDLHAGAREQRDRVRVIANDVDPVVLNGPWVAVGAYNVGGVLDLASAVEGLADILMFGPGNVFDALPTYLNDGEDEIPWILGAPAPLRRAELAAGVNLGVDYTDIEVTLNDLAASSEIIRLWLGNGAGDQLELTDAVHVSRGLLAPVPA